MVDITRLLPAVIQINSVFAEKYAKLFRENGERLAHLYGETLSSALENLKDMNLGVPPISILPDSGKYIDELAALRDASVHDMQEALEEWRSSTSDVIANTFFDPDMLQWVDILRTTAAEQGYKKHPA